MVNFFVVFKKEKCQTYATYKNIGRELILWASDTPLTES